jgi:hypothetical protein
MKTKISNRVAWFGIAMAFLILGLAFAEVIFGIYHHEEMDSSCLWVMLATAMLSMAIYTFCRLRSNALD